MNEYTIKVPASSAFSIKTPDDFIRLRIVTLAVAKHGCGKTCSLSDLLHMIYENNVFDRLILVSPTYRNDEYSFEGLPLDEGEIIEPEMKNAY